MFSKKIASAALAASLALVPAAPAIAEIGDALIGGIIGGIIGGAIVAESNKKRITTTTTRATTQPSISSRQREANREVQIALNHFGFPVGTPDGALGPRSQAAISEYQAMLGYTPTGQLTEYERTLLVGSYHRAVAGGALTMQQAASHPMGMRGLLLTWRDEALNPPGQLASAPAAAPQAMPIQPAAAPQAAPIQPAAASGLPSFIGADTATVSLASHCNDVNMTTSGNGGFVTLATFADPGQALGEQFCLARSFSITQGDELIGRVSGFTPQQIADQCAGFGPAMAPHVAALSTQSAIAVMTGVRAFAGTTGMAPAQLARTAKICLSVGYRNDDLGVAIGSALLLATLGEGAYGELLGHHLSQGIGAATRADLALEWYQLGFDALAAGGTEVFAPGKPERVDLVRKAAYTIAGKADEAALIGGGTVTAASAPGFIILPADPEGETEVLVAADAPPAGNSAIGALPMAARLPFLLFRN